MMKRSALFVFAIAALFALLLTYVSRPAHAQFADQATLLTSVGSSGGGNTVTGTLAPSLTSYNSVNGVLLKIVPNANNTGATTLNLNSLGTSPAVVKMTSSGLAALSGTGCEFVNGVPALLVYLTSVSEFVLMTNSCSNISVGSANLSNSALSYSAPLNLTLGATVGSNQLTLSVCTNNSTLPTCNAPSAVNPILVAFRDPTIANGDPIMRSLTAALSFTIGSGDTMGCVSGQMCRLWEFLIDNAGTVSLCAYNANSLGNIIGLDEAAVQTSQSGTAGGSTAQLLYCSASAVSAKSIRYIGYVDVQETTAGTWSSLPTTAQLFGPGIARPGTSLQRKTFNSTTPTSVSSATKTVTNTSAPITLSSAANVVRVTANGASQSGASSVISAQLSRGSGPTLVGEPNIGNTSSSNGGAIPLSATDQPNTTSSVTYFVFIWNAQGSGTSQWIGTIAGQLFGSDITVEEIMGALEPANDDAPVSKAA